MYVICLLNCRGKIIVSRKEERIGCRTEIFIICTNFQMLLVPLYQKKWRLEVGAAWIHLAHYWVQWSAYVKAGSTVRS
jgi:hypothetical protein